MPTVLIGPTELFIDSKHDGHVKAWRWYCFATHNYHYKGSRIVYGKANA